MKQTKVLVVLAMSALMVFGWIGTTRNIISGGEEKQYNEYISNAKDYMQRKLYQKAIEQYNLASEIENSQKLQSKIMKAYELRYKESTAIYEDYLAAAEKAQSLYPKASEFALDVAELAESQEDYKTAYKYLNNAVDAGADDKKLMSKYCEIKYSYSFDWSEYLLAKPLANGYYAVQTSEGWEYIDETGESDLYNKLSFAGSVSADNIVAISAEDHIELIDSDGVVQGRIDHIPDDIGMSGNNLIPVKNGDVYTYHKLIGEKAFGKYSYAGTFTDSKAAVDKDGKWILIDTAGKKVSKNEYSDIKINTDGTYIKDDVMLAKEKDNYHLYNADEKKIGDFECDDIDIVTDDKYIAYCKDGKWGFVDKDGKTVIKPKYEKAKSFSHGLGAVYDGKKWGFINYDNKLVIDYTFINVDYFNSKGNCMVESGNDSWQLIRLNVEQ